MDEGKKQTRPLIFAMALLACTILATIVAFTRPAESRIVLYSADDDHCIAVIWDCIPHGGITFRTRKGPVSDFVHQTIGEFCGESVEP